MISYASLREDAEQEAAIRLWKEEQRGAAYRDPAALAAWMTRREQRELYGLEAKRHEVDRRFAAEHRHDSAPVFLVRSDRKKPYATEAERVAARRRSWRESKQRKRAA